MSIFFDEEELEKTRKKIDSILLEMKKTNQIKERDYPSTRFVLAYLSMPKHILEYGQQKEYLKALANVPEFERYYENLEKNGYLTVNEIGKMSGVVKAEDLTYQLLLVHIVEGFVTRAKVHPTDYKKDAFKLSEDGVNHIEDFLDSLI